MDRTAAYRLRELVKSVDGWSVDSIRSPFGQGFVFDVQSPRHIVYTVRNLPDFCIAYANEALMQDDDADVEAKAREFGWLKDGDV